MVNGSCQPSTLIYLHAKGRNDMRPYRMFFIHHSPFTIAFTFPSR